MRTFDLRLRQAMQAAFVCLPLCRCVDVVVCDDDVEEPLLSGSGCRCDWC